ncbi:MAG: hypothetical protein KF718_03200 [Polyangiaceae bacterium]|nr:hypothetical protein [Polyangiaceae bacterium]
MVGSRVLAACALTASALCCRPGHATQQWELRATALGLVGDDRLTYDLGLGVAFDAYVTDGIGAMVGLDALVLGYPRERAAPSALAVAPELSLWFGEDAPTFRTLLTVRPVFGVTSLGDGGAHFFERLEVGPGLGLSDRRSSFRVRASLLWTPSKDEHDDALALLSLGLRLTFAWSPPLGLPPAPTGDCPLPCTPGCPC